MHGMTPDAKADAEAAGQPYRPADAYIEKPVGSRAMVAAAGPIANFLLAVVLFAVLLAVQGRPVPLAVVGDVYPHTAAQAAGLQKGDEILTVDGLPVGDFEQLRGIVQVSAGKDLALAVHRGTQNLTVHVHILAGGTNGSGLLGVTSGREKILPVGLPGAFIGGFEETYGTLVQLLGGLAAIVTSGAGVKDLGGPIMIAHLSGQVADLGLASLVRFIALLSVNLGLVNLLPIPVLDGGHLMFYAAEALRGSPVPPRAQEYGYRAGFAVLAALFIFATWNDLSHLGLVKWVAAQFGS
jgi:regulator of sigma E protease